MPSFNFPTKIDEAIGRQFDDEEGGGLADQAQDFFVMTDDPANDDFIVSGAPKQAFDTVWSYEESIGGQYTDEVDAPGAAVWGTDTSFVENPLAATGRTLGDSLTFAQGDWDWSVERNQEQGNAGAKGRLILFALLAAGALFLLAPVLNAFTAVLEATSG